MLNMLLYSQLVITNIIKKGVKVMVGKIVQLLGKQMQDGFEVIYGIDDQINESRSYPLGFGEVKLGNIAPNVTTTYIYGGHIVNDGEDGFKEVIIFNGELPHDAKEEYIVAIIPYAGQLTTNAKRIAGRYYYEAILEMHVGDTVEVSKSLAGEKEVYMVVEAGNELFLIKKNR